MLDRLQSKDDGPDIETKKVNSWNKNSVDVLKKHKGDERRKSQWISRSAEMIQTIFAIIPKGLYIIIKVPGGEERKNDTETYSNK